MTSKIVLMLLANAYDPDPRVRQEALSLSAMGGRVRILAWDRDRKSPAAECLEGIDVRRVYVASTHGRGVTQILFYVAVYAQMFWSGLTTSFDVVHCHDLDTLPIGFVLGKLKRKPIVYDAHESFPDMLAGSVPRVVRTGLMLLETMLVRRIDILVTVGETLRTFFARRGARRAVVVGNWKRLPDFARSEQASAAIRRRLGIPDGALAIVCVTQLLKDRKLEELLAAASTCPSVYVIIGGKGVMEPDVTRAAAQNPRVRFVGFVSAAQIADYTCAADAVYYGFDPANPNARFSAPNKLFEALAAGKPIVTGDFGEIGRVVREGRCGVVLPEYSVAEIARAFEMLRDVNTRTEMARNAAQMGRTSFNWETAEAVLFREYSALLPGLVAPAGRHMVDLAGAPAAAN